MGRTEPLLLVFGDGWSRAVAGRMPRIPQEIKNLRDAFRPQVKPREAAERADERTRATIALLIDALAEGAGHHPKPGAGAASADFVCAENTGYAVRAIWLAAFTPRDSTTQRLGTILRRSLAEPCFADPTAVHDGCVAALVELGTKPASRALRSAAKVAPTIGARERLLVAAARAGRTLASQVAESHVPDHGLDGNGMRVFTVDRGEYRHEYLITLYEDGRVGLTDLDPGAPADEAGEHVAGQEAQKVSDAYEQEVRRIESLLAADRVWNRAEWRRLYWDNAITRTIALGLVWRFEDRSGERRADILPKPDGAFLAQDGFTNPYGSIFASEWSTVRLWHPALVDHGRRQRWGRALNDLGFVQPFPHIDRPVKLPKPDSAAEHLDVPVLRKMIKSVFEDLMRQRGWHWELGDDTTYLAQRDFLDHRLTITLECTAAGTEADDVITRRPAWFHWTADEVRSPLPVVDVPARVYAEAAYDLDILVQGATRPEKDPKRPTDSKDSGGPKTPDDAAPSTAPPAPAPGAPPPTEAPLHRRRLLRFGLCWSNTHLRVNASVVDRRISRRSSGSPARSRWRSGLSRSACVGPVDPGRANRVQAGRSARYLAPSHQRPSRPAPRHAHRRRAGPRAPRCMWQSASLRRACREVELVPCQIACATVSCSAAIAQARRPRARAKASASRWSARSMPRTIHGSRARHTANSWPRQVLVQPTQLEGPGHSGQLFQSGQRPCQDAARIGLIRSASGKDPAGQPDERVTGGRRGVARLGRVHHKPEKCIGDHLGGLEEFRRNGGQRGQHRPAHRILLVAQPAEFTGEQLRDFARAAAHDGAGDEQRIRARPVFGIAPRTAVRSSARSLHSQLVRGPVHR